MAKTTLSEHISELSAAKLFKELVPKNYPKYEDPNDIDRADTQDHVEKAKNELLSLCREIHDMVFHLMDDATTLELIDTTIRRSVDAESSDEELTILMETVNFLFLKALARKSL